jgi:integrase
MRGNSHVRFGGRAEETDPPKGRHRASARSNHSHATHLLAAGVNPKVVSDRLGHASVAFTLDVYGHVLPGQQADAAAAVAALVDG